MDVEGMSVGVGISMTRFLYSAGVVCSSLLLLLGDDTDAVDNLLSDGVTDDLRSIDVLEEFKEFPSGHNLLERARTRLAGDGVGDDISMLSVAIVVPSFTGASS